MQKQTFLSLFISSFIFLVASYFSGAFSTLHLIAFLLFPTIAILRVLGKTPAFAFVLSSFAYVLLFGLEYISTIYLHMSFIFFSLYFLWPQRKALIKGCGSIPKRIGYGVAIFAFMLFASFVVNIILHFAGVSDQEQIVTVVSGLPLYLLIMAFTLGPISEELLFRAFLVPRIGVIASTLLFTFTHMAYGSVAELAGAFALGIVLAVAYSRLRDPLPCMVAHILFNFLSVMLIMLVY
ncbi:MAG: CPBP family intramembrane metalloprotease [bacterium]|nr:CPBP family intramembrane metalloprotease [bacterium]